MPSMPSSSNIEKETSNKESANKFAPYLSYDNYLIENQIGLVNNLEKGRSLLDGAEKQGKKQSADSPTSSWPQVEVKVEPNLDLIEDQNFDLNEKAKFVSY